MHAFKLETTNKQTGPLLKTQIPFTRKTVLKTNIFYQSQNLSSYEIKKIHSPSPFSLFVLQIMMQKVNSSDFGYEGATDTSEILYLLLMRQVIIKENILSSGLYLQMWSRYVICQRWYKLLTQKTLRIPLSPDCASKVFLRAVVQFSVFLKNNFILHIQNLFG